MDNYIKKEILDSLITKVDSYNNEYSVGRIVEILVGDLKGKRGVIQNATHDKSKPMVNDKIRVWVDGFSCTDIFDFTKKELTVMPLVYIPNLGYY